MKEDYIIMSYDEIFGVGLAPSTLAVGRTGLGDLGWWGACPFCTGAQWFAELVGLSLRAQQARSSLCSWTCLSPWELPPESWLHHFCAWAAHALALGCVWDIIAICSGAPTVSWVKGLGVMRGLLCFWCLLGPWHLLCAFPPNLGCRLWAQTVPIAMPHSQLCAPSKHHTASACPVLPLAFHPGLPPSLP